MQQLILMFVGGLMLLLVTTVLAHLFFLVPYVPTKKRVMEKMIVAAQLKKNDTVVDLGCGDGRLLIAAEKRQRIRTGIGFEIAPLIYLLALIRKTIARSKTKIHFKSFFNAPLKKANVIFCYLFPNVMPRLADKIKKECKKGTRIVSNTFSIPGLRLIKKYPKNPAAKLPSIYVYQV